jgi:Na+-translocating ferredoxin:NAD+ oxidoreductase RnfG subunit
MKTKLIFPKVAVILIMVCATVITGCSPTLILESEAETLESVRYVFDEGAYYHYYEEADIYGVYNSGKKLIGYLFYAHGMGETIPAAEGLSKTAGPIVILVGMEDTETIKGIYVVSHSETELYWASLVKQDYFSQFEGLKIEEAYFSFIGGGVDAIAGATTSSKLVLNTVKDAAKQKAVYIEEGLK